MVIHSCKSSREYHGSVTHKKIYSIDENYFPISSMNYQFNTHFATLGTEDYFVYLDSHESIVLRSANFSNKKKISIDFSHIVSKLGYFSVRFVKDSIYLLDITNRKLLRFLITEHSINLIATFDFKHLFDWERYSLTFQFNNCFEIDPPYLYLPYALNDSKSNFLPDTAFLKIELGQDSIYKITNKILFHPPELKKRTSRDTYPILTKINDTAFVLGFEGNDSIYLYNPIFNRITKRQKFEKHFSYRQFKSSKATDLSYVRWFDQTAEMNLKILYDKRENLMIIRKLQKDKIIEENSYAYYILDLNLNVKAFNVFPYKIDPFLCFSYQKGFLVFTKDRTQAYYYEVD